MKKDEIVLLDGTGSYHIKQNQPDSRKKITVFIHM